MAGETHSNEKPKYWPEISRRSDALKTACALHDFLPDQACLIFNKTWNQYGVARCSENNFDILRLTGLTGSHKEDRANGCSVILRMQTIIGLVNWAGTEAGYLVCSSEIGFRFSNG